MNKIPFTHNRYMIINKVTGEEVPIQTFIKEAGIGEKAHVKTLAEYIGITGTSYNKVLAYLIKEKTASNIINGTVRSISAELGIAPASTAKLFKIMQDREFLKKVRNGCYMLSPALLRHGSSTRGAMMLRLWGDA